ncbi:MAG: CAP domain-containing protein, partial [Clostridium sp.]|nr:CAP domain-containing protein [Clostridium sp.]
AQTRAREIEKSFSHTRPDGSSFNTALTEAGVSFRGAGENIAYGQTTPQQVMEGWMNSSGHRANILNANYTSIGVGHYKNGAGVDYWAQLFIQ